jgi:hypothetical protein
MTAHPRTAPETLSTPPPPPGRGVRTAAALTVFAAVVFTPWLLTTNQSPAPGSIVHASVAAQLHQAASAQNLASAGSNLGSINRPTAYRLFCENSPVLCMTSAPAALPTGYLLFCENSPSLCPATKRS